MLVQAVLQKIGPNLFGRMAEPRVADAEGTKDLREFKQKIPALAKDLQSLEKLLGMDVPSTLNKIRYIAEKVLYGVAPRDPLTFTLLPLLLGAVALLATLTPGTRAARMDPVSSLKR